jgi:hypothetical protein
MPRGKKATALSLAAFHDRAVTDKDVDSPKSTKRPSSWVNPPSILHDRNADPQKRPVASFAPTICPPMRSASPMAKPDEPELDSNPCWRLLGTRTGFEPFLGTNAAANKHGMDSTWLSAAA